MTGHDFSRQITEKCGTKYENGNYILGHPKWKWKLYFGTAGVKIKGYLLNLLSPLCCFVGKGDYRVQTIIFNSGSQVIVSSWACRFPLFYFVIYIFLFVIYLSSFRHKVLMVLGSWPRFIRDFVRIFIRIRILICILVFMCIFIQIRIFIHILYEIRINMFFYWHVNRGYSGTQFGANQVVFCKFRPRNGTLNGGVKMTRKTSNGLFFSDT